MKFMLLIAVLLFVGCSDNSTSKKSLNLDQRLINAELQGMPYFLNLEIRSSCRAVIGEMSSSCCSEVAPFSLKIPVPKLIFESFSVGDDLLEYDLATLEFLKISNTKNIENIIILEKVTSNTKN
jgi:hypothetical protein